MKMNDYIPDTSNAALEGDDAPQPLRVFLYKDGYASVDGEVLLSAFGPNSGEDDSSKANRARPRSGCARTPRRSGGHSLAAYALAASERRT
jgi:hypothetical protein